MEDLYNMAIKILNSPIPNSSLEKNLALLYLSNPVQYDVNHAMLNDITNIYNRLKDTHIL